jgi:hypothetical protein
MELVILALTTQSLITRLRHAMIHSVAKGQSRKRTVPVKIAKILSHMQIGIILNVSIGNDQTLMIPKTMGIATIPHLTD